MKEPKKKQFPLWTEQSEIDMWKKEAKDEKRSVNKLIINAIDEHLQRKKRGKGNE